ncbi:MAG: hypothetical protein ACYTEQ_17305 [Planctomycetota bacterium]|jgi:hypothetical protein
MREKVILTLAGFCLLMSCRPSPRDANSTKAANPTPPDAAKGVSPDTKLSWTSKQKASYNVYFGRKSPPPFVGKQSGTTFNPGPLDWDTTYYWKVDIVDGAEGDIWKFTTFWYGDPNAEEMDI